MPKNELIPAALEALDGYGIQATFDGDVANGRGQREDGMVHLRRGKIRLDYVAEAKRGLNATTMGAVTQQIRALERRLRKPVLLVTEHVGAETAETLRERRHQFIDTAGNAYIEGPGLYLFVLGRRPDKPLRNRVEGRAFTPAGLKVLFALLCDPALAGKPLRPIAQTADVALGALPGILADLERLGHLAVAGRRRRLIGTKRFLDEWAMAYARKPMMTRVMAAPRIDGWERWNVIKEGGRWGGEAAAALLVGHIKPGRLTLYAAHEPNRLIAEHGLATTPDAAHEDGRVELITGRMNAPLLAQALAAKAPREDVVPAALVYADLLMARDARCLEVADLVYEKYLARLFPKS